MAMARGVCSRTMTDLAGHCQQAVNVAKKFNPRLSGFEERGGELHDESGHPVNDLELEEIQQRALATRGEGNRQVGDAF